LPLIVKNNSLPINDARLSASKKANFRAAEDEAFSLGFYTIKNKINTGDSLEWLKDEPRRDGGISMMDGTEFSF
jgi:hypothetical protein